MHKMNLKSSAISINNHGNLAKVMCFSLGEVLVTHFGDILWNEKKGKLK